MLKHLLIFRSDKIARSIGIVFAVVGILFGTWATLIPYIKDKFKLDEAELGTLLLLLPLGAAVMNPISVPLINKLGTVKATLISLIGVSLFIILPANLPSLIFVAFGLFLFGMGFSAVNIAMNTCASQFELHAQKSIIATCHGLWSGGAMLGSAFAGIAYAFGANPQIYIIGVAAMAIVVGSVIKNNLYELPDKHFSEEVKTSTSKAFVRPNKSLWILIIMGLCVNLGEGSMVDWSAVYLKEVLGANEAVASVGFAVYSFFMMSGRLLGDGLVTNIGSKKVLSGCAILMMLGFITAVFAPNIYILFLGYAMIGSGVSLGSPILYATSAKVPGLPKGAGLAVYNTYAMVGFLGGPVLIGFVAKAHGLPVGFSIIAFFSFVWFLASRRLS